MLEDPGGHSVIKQLALVYWHKVGIPTYTSISYIYKKLLLHTCIDTFSLMAKENMEKGNWLLKNSERASQSSLLLKSLFS